MEDKPLKADFKRREDGTFGEGNHANDAGRPTGSTLKEYQATKFRAMSDEDKEKYLVDIGAGEKWRMSEGNPAQTTEAKVEITLPTPLLEVTRKDDEQTSSN